MHCARSETLADVIQASVPRAVFNSLSLAILWFKLDTKTRVAWNIAAAVQPSGFVMYLGNAAIVFERERGGGGEGLSAFVSKCQAQGCHFREGCEGVAATSYVLNAHNCVPHAYSRILRASVSLSLSHPNLPSTWVVLYVQHFLPIL